jgi:hypothetical protein
MIWLYIWLAGAVFMAALMLYDAHRLGYRPLDEIRMQPWMFMTFTCLSWMGVYLMICIMRHTWNK